MAASDVKQKKMGGNFFKVSVEVAKLIAEQTKSAEAVLAYMVLCKNKQRKSEQCTGGALAIAEALGVTRHEADKYLKALSSVSWGANPTDRALVSAVEWNKVAPESVPEKMGKFQVKVLPSLGDQDLYLDNTFVTPPDERFTTPILKIRGLPQQQRLDTLMLLIELYWSHRLGEFGGVNPQLVSVVWTKQRVIDISDHEKAYDPEFGRFYGSVKSGNVLYTQDRTMSGMFNDGGERFAVAIRNLVRAGIAYEAAVTFSKDPIKSSDAEVLYTLRAFDKNIEPYNSRASLEGLATAASTAIEGLGLHQELLGEAESYKSGSKADLHVYAAPTEEAHVVGIFRLRHCRNAYDSINEQAIEQRRAARWEEALENAPYYEDEGLDSFTFEATVMAY